MILVHCTPFEPIFLKESKGFRMYVWFNVVVLVLHSGEYYMFESDSGEEDESFQEEQKPRRQTAFQVTCFVLTLFYVWWGGFYRDKCVKFVSKLFSTAGIPGLGHQRKRSSERPSAEAESGSKEATNLSGYRLNIEIYAYETYSNTYTKKQSIQLHTLSYYSGI